METAMKCQSTEVASTVTAKPWWKLTTKEKKISMVLFGLLTLGVSTPHHFAVVISESIDHRVFFITKRINEIKQGDYLLYSKSDFDMHIRRGSNGYTTDNMLKIVACIPGDALNVSEGLYYTCNGAPIGNALKKDSKGRDLPIFKFNGTIPAGQYFMTGTHPRSFDSKYYGLVDMKSFLAKAYPIW